MHVSRLTRAGLAAALVLGVGAALPSLAADAVYADDTGSLELPSPVFSASDLAFDFASCPEAPPNQGVDAWVYELPEQVAVLGAPVTVTGTDSAGPTDITAYVYDDDCTYDRVVSSPAALTFALEDDDRFVAVTTTTGVGTALSLEVAAAPTVEPTPTTGPTGSPAPGEGSGTVMTRGDYSSGVDDPFYPETSTGPVGDIGPGGQWGMRMIRAEQAWQQPQATGAGIRVAVLDSGMDVTHEDFQCPGKIARLPQSYTRFADVTDTDGHGTHVAGIVGACTGNGTGVVGTAPDATILPIQALSATDATAERLAEAIRAAADNGAHVINMSLGFGVAPGGLVTLPGSGSALALVGAFAEEVDPAIEYAVSKGVVVVAAAGNESFPLCGYPALAADVVCVGSTDRRDLNAWYGNFPITPSGVALMAPGGSGQVFCDVQSENVLSTYSTQAENACAYPAEGYRGLDGTSMASPHVAGVAALVYDRLGGARSPEAAAAVKQALVDGAVDLYTPGYDPVSGEGRVDALGAVQAVTAVTPTPTPTPTGTTSTATDLALIAPGTGSTTDSLPVAARLSEGEERVSGAPVQFSLTGPGGSRTAAGTTDADGVTTAELPLDLAPGSYTLTASYAGDGSRQGSSAEQAVTVVRDTSATTLAVTGKGGSRSLSVSLQDADASPTGLAGRAVVLLADGRQIGTVTTGSDGTATFAPTGKDRSAKRYEARFAGDDSYEGSSATA